jgi:hypothetical protein
MKKYIIGLIGLFIILLVIGIALLRSRSPAKVTLTNGSSMTVSNVQVDGEHFGQFLGTMTPGMSMSFTLTKPSEKEVWVFFDAAGQSFDSRGKKRTNYFEASSRHPLSLIIEADLSVISSRSIKSH